MIGRAVPGLIPTAAAMPVPDNYGIDAGQVTPFGLSGPIGHRHFQTGLEIRNGSSGTVPVLAMLEGTLSLVGSNVAIEPSREDGSHFVTQRSGLLLKVHPRSGFGRVIRDNPDDPIEFPLPAWIIYEGVEPENNSMVVDRYENLDQFAFDAHALPTNASALIDDIALDLDADPDLRVRLIGHTDAEGNTDRNYELGRQRAEAVRSHLIGQGIDSGRIQIESKGETRPIIPNPPDRTIAGANRRVEIEVCKSDEQVVKPGDLIGTAPNGVLITVLDPLSYYLDPLTYVLRASPELGAHPLSAFRDPLAPSVASHRVHVICADPTNDAADRQYPLFFFSSSISSEVSAAKANDVIWIDQLDVRVNLVLDQPVTLLGKPGQGGNPPTISPANNQFPIIAYENTDTQQRYGLRVLGLKLRDGAHPPGGCAMRLSSMENVHILNCTFANNKAYPDGADPSGAGGALALRDCRNILIHSCRFHENKAERGGAIYAFRCKRLVVTGDPIPDFNSTLTSETSYTVKMSSLDPNAWDGVPHPELPAPLTGVGSTSRFVFNQAHKAGAGISLDACEFRIRHSYFVRNLARADTTSYGGAVSAVRCEHSAKIERCVASGNNADFGGAFGLSGSFDDGIYLNGNMHTPIRDSIYVLDENILYDNYGYQMGGGVHSAGVESITLQGSWISKNTGGRNGGGVVCMSVEKAELVNNCILNNLVTGDFRNIPYTTFDPLPPTAVGGGGAGIYASLHPLFQPSLILEGNRIIGNISCETGGGLRATCGATVRMKRGNLFRNNVAYLHGGAVALNSATLLIESGNSFEYNATIDGRTQDRPQSFRGGHGGAIYCLGGRVAANQEDDMRWASCASGGAELTISGTNSQPVRFEGNMAVQEGGAIYIERDDSADNYVPRIVRGSILSAIFSDNRSFAPITIGNQILNGSGITIRNLDNPLPFTLPFVLDGIYIESVQGIALRMIHSTQSLQRSNITYTHLPGAGNVVDEAMQS